MWSLSFKLGPWAESITLNHHAVKAVAVTLSEQKNTQFSDDIIQCQEDEQYFIFIFVISGLRKIHKAVV